MRAEQITPVVTEHGEGIVFTPRWRGARCVDMLAGDLLELRAEGVARRHIGRVAALVRPRVGSGYLVARERDIVFAADNTLEADLVAIPELWHDPAHRMNEGGCSPSGELYIGSMSYEQERGAGQLYRMGADRRPEIVLPRVTVSNGLVWSPDSATAYYADTATDRIDAFDWSPERGLVNRRPFAQTPSPDGMCMDAEGGLWVAGWGRGTVTRFDSSGGVDAVLAIPAHQVTCVGFAGSALDTLLVTTSRLGLGADAEPGAGAVFAVQPGVVGVPLAEFAG